MCPAPRPCLARTRVTARIMRASALIVCRRAGCYVAAVAGRPKSRAAPRTVNKRTLKKRRLSRDSHEDVGTALLKVLDNGGAELVLAPECSTADLLSFALRRVHATMLWAGRQADDVPLDQFWVDKWDAQGNRLVEPNKWFQLERAMRDEAVKLAARMQELGLAERAVALEEAKAVMVAQAVRAAAEAAGFDEEQVQRLGVELRKSLESGAVVEVAA